METALIMCAGSGSRWLAFRKPSQPLYKQFIEIYGVRIIDRTLKQLDMRGLRSIVVCPNSEFADQLGSHTHTIIDSPSLMYSILASIHLATPPYTVILGDTIFDSRDMDTIFGISKGSITFYGKTFETFAVRFESDHSAMLWKVNSLIGYDIFSGRINEGKLRDLRYYHRYGRLPRRKGFSELIDRRADPNYVFLSGWTTDIDHNASLSAALDNLYIKEAFQKL